jgi:hypothetical protein
VRKENDYGQLIEKGQKGNTDDIFQGNILAFALKD